MDYEQLRTWCLSLPGVEEDLKWEHNMTWCVGKKMFAVVGLDNEPLSISFKVDPALFDGLINRDHIGPAPYLARYRWIRLDDLNAMPEEELKHFLAESYRMIFEKLTRKERSRIQAATSDRPT